jgi:hypothetical protein
MAGLNTTRNTGYNAGKQQPARRQADGFINIYVKSKTGRRKLGAIFLFDDDAGQAHLRQWLESDETNILKLAEAFEVEYNPNKPDEDKMFVLPE